MFELLLLVGVASSPGDLGSPHHDGEDIGEETHVDKPVAGRLEVGGQKTESLDDTQPGFLLVLYEKLHQVDAFHLKIKGK